MSALHALGPGLMLTIGAALVLVGALGLVRMPDLYNRMQAASKAPVLGALFILIAVAWVIGGRGVWIRALSTVAFLVLTTPIAAHLIARAAWAGGVQPEEGTPCERAAPGDEQPPG